MANFPSNPSNGNTHIIGNTIWVYNSTSDSWLIQDVNEYAVANLENTPPANPDEGTIWYDSQTTGRLYIYIDSNWIDASPGDVSVIIGGNDITSTKSGATYTLNVDDSFVRNTGDTMTGTLTMSNSNTNFNSTNTGVNWAMNTDGAYIKFFNTGDGDSNSRLEYATFDNGNEYHRWLVNSTERMRVTGTGAKITGNLDLESGNPQITFNGTSDSGVDMAIKATPEGLDFYEPEDGNKIHFQILDDTGVNAPYGYKWNGQSLDDRYISGISTGGGLSGSGTSGTVTLSHADTSSQGSSNNSGRTYIQDITLDTYGHVTGIATATETVVNTDTNTTYSAGGGLSLSGTTFSHSDTSSQSSVNNSGRTYIQDITLDGYGHVTSIASATETGSGATYELPPYETSSANKNVLFGDLASTTFYAGGWRTTGAYTNHDNNPNVDNMIIANTFGGVGGSNQWFSLRNHASDSRKFELYSITDITTALHANVTKTGPTNGYYKYSTTVPANTPAFSHYFWVEPTVIVQECVVKWESGIEMYTRSGSGRANGFGGIRYWYQGDVGL